MVKARTNTVPLGLLAAGVAGGLASLRLLRTLRAADLRGKVVLITGASRGLGYVLAEEFARHGARLALCARDNNTLQRAAEALQSQGAETFAISCDVSQREQVEHLIALVTDHFGRIDILVNNAGVIMVGPVLNQTLADFEEEMAITFWGSLYATLAVLPQMTERHTGNIVNITSIGGKVSIPHLLPYSSAKFALVGLSEGLRSELARDGVTVTTVAPGLMRTGSPINAFVKGDHRAEYTWFTLGDSLPPAAMSARRAARQIVAATRRGDAEAILSVAATGLSLFHGVFPGLTSDILGLVNRFLPSERDNGAMRWRGDESETPLTQSFLTTLTRQAAQDYQERAANASEKQRLSAQTETQLP